MVAVRVVDIIYLGEQKVRHRGQEGGAPAHQRHQAGSSQVGQGENVERRADGQVSLQGEGLTLHCPDISLSVLSQCVIQLTKIVMTEAYDAL